MSAGDVWFHDARPLPSLTLETEFSFPSEGGGYITRTTRVVIDEPPTAVIEDAIERFWASTTIDEDE